MTTTYTPNGMIAINCPADVDDLIQQADGTIVVITAIEKTLKARRENAECVARETFVKSWVSQPVDEGE